MRKKIIYTLLTVVWMAVIFGLSNDPAEESGKKSLAVGKFICSITVKGYHDMTVSQQEELAEKIEHPIRKCGHMTEFAILGVLLLLTLSAYTYSSWRWAAAFIGGVVYAASDEIHQLFIPGRSGQITDVLIDSAGLLIGILFIYLMNYCLKQRKKIKN